MNKTGNGTVSPPGANTVVYGDDLAISAIADDGYHFVNWTTADGLTIDNTTIASTVINNITASGVITANFAINQYSVTIASSGNGSTSPSSVVTVGHGSNLR